MPTKTVTFDNSTPGTKLFGEDPRRTAFTVYVPPTQDAVSISDERFAPGDSFTVLVNPGELLFIGKNDGHNVSKPWYIISETVGTNEAMLYEAFKN